MAKRVLFILKQRLNYGNYSYSAGFSSGLFNSALFAADMLTGHGFVTKLVEVVDNNDIDREVTLFKPDIVIIEALWVVPDKFNVLQALHPTVKWIVRVHSEAPFLAQESISIDWISRYAAKANVFVAMNSQEGFEEIVSVYIAKALPLEKLLYLPTFYPVPDRHFIHPRFRGGTFDVACMGAIRPLKNTLLQAIAAIRYAQSRGLDLVFHINSTRVESGGGPVFQNILALFDSTPYQLVQHPWMTHQQFMDFMVTMDLGMQASFSETFSIIAADTVSVGTPIVGSEAIPWLTRLSQADALTVDGIEDAIDSVINNFRNNAANFRNLTNTARDAEKAWLSTLR
jgi:hypothetical protein